MKHVVSYIFIIFILSSCTKYNQNDNDNIPLVFATTNAAYDFTNKIGEDKINLKRLIPLGAEVHDWEPTVKDRIELEEADIIFYNGGGLEPWIDSLKNSIDNKNVLFIDLSQDIYASIEHNKGIDPHFWLNPIYAKNHMELIANTLIEKNPDEKEFYLQRLDENIKKLDKLDEDYSSALLNTKNNTLIVYHSAYGHLSNRYNLNQMALDNLISESSEPTLNVMVEIIKIIIEQEIKNIYYSNISNKKTMETISDEAGDIGVLPLNTFEGDMGEELGGENEYFSVMYRNLEELKKEFNN